MSGGLDDARLERYARHVIMDEIGLDGQERLGKSSALVVGVGGLGCPCSTYLASCGFGEVTLVDDDRVETSNLQRQTLFRDADVGEPKAEVAAKELRSINPNVSAVAVTERADENNLDGLVSSADVVVDASDNFMTRHAVNAACHAARTDLVSGSAERFDGQVAAFAFSRAATPCYCCLFPADGPAPEQTPCSILGVFAPLTGLVGSVMATEAVRLACGMGDGDGLGSRMLALDALGMRFVNMGLSPSPGCSVCGGGP